MTAVLKYIAVAGATGGLALLYIGHGRGLLALPIGVVGVLWALGSRHGRRRPADWGLLFLVTAAAVGLWLGIGVWGTFLTVVVALSAWDLDHLDTQLREVPRTAATRLLERRHLLRLLLVDGASVAAAGLSTALHLEIGTGTAILLGVLLISGLGEVVAFFRRESD